MKYLKKFVNTYTLYELDDWPKGLMTIFKLKGRLFGVTNIVKEDDKSKLLFIGYGIRFDGVVS